MLVGKPRFVPVNLNPPAKRNADEDVKARVRSEQSERGSARSRTTRRRTRAANATARRRPVARARRRRSISFSSTTARSCASTMPDASTDRSLRSTTRPTTSPRRCPRSSCATKTTAASRAFLTTARRSNSNSTSWTGHTRKVARHTTRSPRFLEPTSQDEVIMLGGHLDSWHSATGATDNAIGCSIMMEAARILLKLGVQPRRTIRVALWSGEEEGILGSQAYVKEHFGSFEAPKPEFSKLVAYLNIDTGTGQLRGASVFGPPAAATTLREICRAVPGSRDLRRGDERESGRRRDRQHRVQQRRPARDRLPAGPDRIQHAHAPHESGYLRARHRRGCEEGGDHRGVDDLSPVAARRNADAVRARRDAGASAPARGRAVRR